MNRKISIWLKQLGNWSTSGQLIYPNAAGHTEGDGSTDSKLRENNNYLQSQALHLTESCTQMVHQYQSAYLCQS